MLQMKPESSGAHDFKMQNISLCGKAFVADRSGALYWPSEEALIIADLHLEKGSSYAAQGQLLPPYDTRETLRRLAEAIDRFDAKTVIALGDSFHDREAAERMESRDAEALRIMQNACEWIWVTGNHDPQIAQWRGG